MGTLRALAPRLRLRAAIAVCDHPAMGRRARSARSAITVVAASLALASCGSPPPPSPSVVIVADPPAICAGDAHRTRIRLSARDSQTRLTLVPDGADPGPKALSLSWSFEGAARRIVEGDPHAIDVVVTTEGDRPLFVTLDATNDVGGEGTARLTVGITIADSTGGCPPPAEEPEP